ncbi:tRNA (uridine-2'-O-)-methyltransferase TRM7 [Cordyceps fumosorosea ARSEF 2679]|uniref:Putative tRNA (cytidine(32)/guanosine(34)-2'-O)-methyltransferase n=1 Tax=Cordyceps fumosorosea (strain ARSEF 2679) TaxID=1081104 RepID=A0A167XC13_CORFA|nr:tRNA (uridine-2'-O-)-methyltransferase TRM7 [Cordyceps fumosorosea ARSEF 2679]OAA64785.1 tRNA (uridine-2'-O-)-methyltransferase TRM7 [Cordyceps fumosorosea ARSEF 2679]
MGKSSKDKRDAYYRLAKEQGWRAPPPVPEFDLFSNVSRVVDLCAAPGSWSQVLSRVLIQGEKFGRAAWQDREARLRQQMLNVLPPAAADDDQAATDKPLHRDHQPAAAARRDDVKIVSIDLQPIAPLAGITTLRADITHPATVPLLLSALDSTADRHPVDLVLSDGAPDVTGLHDLDIYVQSQLLFAALNLALCVLRPGGAFVAKIFRGRNVDVLYAQLKLFFETVVVAKPRSSRASSVEAFIVCRGFRPPPGFRASLEAPLGVGARLGDMVADRRRRMPLRATGRMQDPTRGTWDAAVGGGDDDDEYGHRLGYDEVEEGQVYDGDEDEADTARTATTDPSKRWIAPFIACGDLSAFDSDASYTLPEDYVSLDPVQPPIAPPYKRAIEMRAALSKSR